MLDRCLAAEEWRISVTALADKRVLLVEDDAMVRGLVSRHLTRKGYEVAEAPDAEEHLPKQFTH